MISLAKNSIGVGDRFAHQARPQLQACIKAAEHDVEIVPVWNKSNREHLICGSEPASVRSAADAAVKELGWTLPYHVDADHIGLDTVERFIASSDFFTIDVADSIGAPCDPAAVRTFTSEHPELIEAIPVPGIDEPLESYRPYVERVVTRYMAAVQEAAEVHRRILSKKRDFIAEVSLDETDTPQTPTELLIILAMLSDAGVPAQTIAPKFTGRFNKGVDYVGDAEAFETEFNNDIAVVAYAVEHYSLPENLKLSVHSGSDKFSIYPAMCRALKRTGAGLHVKTAGTSWLEEVIGLADAGGTALMVAKEIYSTSLYKQKELCAPYAAVIDIDESKLPSSETVRSWTSAQFIGALRHDASNPLYNSSLRQLLHVGYKVAAQMGDRYIYLLEEFDETIAKHVTENLYNRHIARIFPGLQ